MPSGFRPDRYAKDKKSFGRHGDPGWMPAQPHQRTQLKLARIQHRLAVHLRAFLGERVAESLAADTGQDVHYVTRKLNGQVPLTAEDLIAWTRHAGADIEDTLAHVYGAPDTPPNP